MKVTAAIYKIYGKYGHRQRESFYPSHTLNCGDYAVGVINSDVSKTNEFSLVLIVGKMGLDELRYCLYSQLADGIFECSNVGDVELCDVVEFNGEV